MQINGKVTRQVMKLRVVYPISFLISLFLSTSDSSFSIESCILCFEPGRGVLKGGKVILLPRASVSVSVHPAMCTRYAFVSKV